MAETNKCLICGNLNGWHYASCPNYDRGAIGPGEKITTARRGNLLFYQILEEAASIHEKKSHDYAINSDPMVNYRTAGMIAHKFRDHTEAGLAGRFAEKVMRLLVLEEKIEVLNESVEDTENDLLVILALFIARRRERRAEKSK